jgi:excinuclease ABC subunit A
MAAMNEGLRASVEARERNLKSIDVDIPRDALVVFTGVSGSGKFSLAFETLYAEAQRRYLESVSPYARRLFHQLSVPALDIGLRQCSPG